MSDEIYTLRELSRVEQIANTDRELLPTVLIANTDPSQLKTAVTSILSENYLASEKRNAAKQDYEAELERWDSTDETPDLYLAARRSIEADKQHLVLLEQTKLARDIEKRKAQLARPMRIGTVLLCALAVGGAPAGYFYLDASRAPRKTQTERLAQSSEEKSAQAFGAVGGLLGGVAGIYVGFGLVGREAKRRAQKIIAKQ